MNKNEKTTLSHIGSLIEKAEASLLKESFKAKYKDQVNLISITKDLILKIFNKNPDSCGIKFLYGMTSVDDSYSKFIMLVPCISSVDNSRPIPKIDADGFYTNTGSRIELIQAWESLCNYVKYMREVDNELGFEDVSRSCFFGKESLNQLLNIKGMEGINYFFGYDDFTQLENRLSRYRVVIEPFANNIDHNIYMDHGGLFTPPGDTRCFVKKVIIEYGGYDDNTESKIDIFRNFRNMMLVNSSSDSILEMYYQTTDALVEKINTLENSSIIYQDMHEKMINVKEKLRDKDYINTKEIIASNINLLVSDHLLN
ncbi:MAG: hypothetical protein ACO1NK_02255 [Sediminibacterium sp.]